ncbi:hypothetical protein BH11PSE12_BH11PSE12_26910 [soil metagenome]
MPGLKSGELQSFRHSGAFECARRRMTSGDHDVDALAQRDFFLSVTALVPKRYKTVKVLAG